MTDYLSELNPSQREAATTLEGPLMILAGAGTGKTKTIISRVAHMINSGVSPKSILLLTFTNKAAKEMKERAAKLIGGPANDITACTFHSFCTSFLRENAGYIGMEPDFTVLDASDARDAIAIVRDKFLAEAHKNGDEYSLEEFPASYCIEDVYSKVINRCMKLSEVISDDNLYAYQFEIHEIIKKYREYKKAHNLMDYDDLLFFTLQILSKHPDVAETLDIQYEYKLIDEYQDTNVIQDRIIHAISKVNPNLAVVGDAHQSIYKFRGANVENIISFDERHPKCKTITLSENYRSSQEILDVSNAFMENVIEGVPNILHGQFHGNRPKLVVVDNNFEECDYIVSKIIRHHNEGVPYSKIAVLERSSRSSYSLEMKLGEHKIPFVKYGGLKFTDKAFIKDILSFLRVLVNHKDGLAMHRILQLYPGIGRVYSEKITEEINFNGLPYLKVMFPKCKFAPYLKELATTLEHIRPMKLDAQLTYLIESYYPQIMDRVIRSSKKDASKKLESLAELKSNIEEAKELYLLANGYDTAVKFLSDFVLDSNNNQDEEGNDRVIISTIHSAKGLEYDIVFIMDVVDGVTPKTTIADPEEDAEELRVFYVATTRARKELYLLVPKETYKHGGQVIRNQLSHFINYDSVLKTLDCSSTFSEMFGVRHVIEDSWDSNAFSL